MHSPLTSEDDGVLEVYAIRPIDLLDQVRESQGGIHAFSHLRIQARRSASMNGHLAIVSFYETHRTQIVLKKKMDTRHTSLYNPCQCWTHASGTSYRETSLAWSHATTAGGGGGREGVATMSPTKFHFKWSFKPATAVRTRLLSIDNSHPYGLERFHLNTYAPRGCSVV